MTRGYRPIVLTGLSLILGLAWPASAQTLNEPNQRTYASRVGDRDPDPFDIGFTGNAKAGERINSRLNSRLDTRLDRFVLPQADQRTAYTPKVDDSTKR